MTSGMGKSGSKHKQPDTGQQQATVKKRKKKKGGKDKPRPVSDPGAAAHLDFPTNFSALPKPEDARVDLTGKRPQSMVADHIAVSLTFHSLWGGFFVMYYG